MRKKLLAVALVFALVFTLCACGAEAQTAKEASQIIEATATPEPTPEETRLLKSFSSSKTRATAI